MSLRIRSLALGTACAAIFAISAQAQNFAIAGGDLATALDAYISQTGVQLIVSEDAVKGVRTSGVRGDLSPADALARLLSGTGFATHREDGAIGIVRRGEQSANPEPVVLAQAAPMPRAVETVTVTSSKLGGADVQSIPIAITALSQEQLAATQTTGGPDLIKQVPNMTFTKTNFSGYSIQLRGIGTQAISVTTDPAVAVAFNDMPFIRNHFFEQEFYDVSQVEVLRGPQGTLYGRNATAGVVNLVSAKPTDQFEAMASADIGNYKNRRFEGMINLPIVDDRLDLRIAGEWTKRNGYSFNALTNSPIDGRDLWSARATVGLKLSENLKSYLVWEHYQENDDRMRSSKQLCKRDPGLATVDGFSTATGPDGQTGVEYLGQGCLPSSLYSAEAFGVPNALSLPYYGGFLGAGFGQAVDNPLFGGATGPDGEPYASESQPRDLRVIESTLNPVYKGKNDVFELNTDYAITPGLTLTSQTGFNQDFLWSTEDYNRFNTFPGIFNYAGGHWGTLIEPNGDFCDPQLGCSNRLVAEDLSDEHAWQLNQEFRLASNFSGPLNFSIGGNYLHYETEENYYVFINTFTMYAAKGALSSPAAINWIPGVSDNEECVNSFRLPDPKGGGNPELCKGYIDPNPIDRLNNMGHNYFLSENPYVLNSYAGFGEAYYQLFNDLKLIGGLRWTDDEKHFADIPSEIFADGWGYPISGIVDQQWQEWTGRFTANWTPKLDFTDQTMVYGSFSHGYKAGGANPPGATLLVLFAGDIGNPVHPLTFKPEFINAYEVGTKNSLLDGALTFNGDFFFYDYKNYQISEIVDRTSINLNFDATVRGAEVETTWEPLPGLKFSFAGGYENTRMANGSKAIDLMDRTAGNPDWVVVKPFVTQASNCVLPTYVVGAFINPALGLSYSYELVKACGLAYNNHVDPLTQQPYKLDPPGIPPGFYAGFDPVSPDATNFGAGPAPNNGAGFDKDLAGNDLPNAPHFTTSFTAEYSMPVTEDWAATLHGDFYWQSSSWARVFNDDPYDRIHGNKNVNFALILTNQNGWQATGYVKNVFDTTAITGTFLNSDDTGLTTNVFLTDPRLFGVRVTKNW